MPPGGPKIDGNRLLVRLGLGNMLSACVGGITSGINIGPSVVNRTFGAKSSRSVLINAAALLAVIFVLFPRGEPDASRRALGRDHGDRRAAHRSLVDRSRSPHPARPLRASALLLVFDLVVVAVVALLSVTINIVLAVFIGIVIAIALFVARVSRSNIRRMYRCDSIRSRKARGRQHTALLEKLGARIVVLELHGVLFFGTAETLSEEIERNCRGRHAHGHPRPAPGHRNRRDRHADRA